MNVYRHFGLHETETGIRFLLQGNNQITHRLGVQIEIPARIFRRNWHCPHSIMLGDDTVAEQLPRHPLVELFLPLPKGPQYTPIYMEESPKHYELVVELRRLCSATIGVGTILLFDMFKGAAHGKSNLLPLVARGATTKFYELDLLASTLPTPLIVMAPREIGMFRSPFIDVQPVPLLEQLKGLPLERIGAETVRRYLEHRDPHGGLWAS